MKRITAIEPQKNNPSRVNIYLDDEFAFGLSRFIAGWLEEGQELDEEKILALQTDDAVENSYQKAIHFLSYRPRSSAEVRKNLGKRGIPQNLIEITMDRLEKAGLVNDHEFARIWIENRNSFQPRSKSLLRLELRRKGLSDEVVQLALSEEQVDEEILAIKAARNYARRLAGKDWLEFRKKLMGYLARRGFSYSTLSSVILKTWKEIHTAGAGGTLNDKD
jgi:regulatory protein